MIEDIVEYLVEDVVGGVVGAIIGDGGATIELTREERLESLRAQMKVLEEEPESQRYRVKINQDGYDHDDGIDQDDVKSFFRGVRKYGKDRQETYSEEEEKANWKAGQNRVKKRNIKG